MRHKQQLISIIVPVYNEKGNIEHFHKQLIQGLENLPGSYEIIYIDDHSTDGTYEWLRVKGIKSIKRTKGIKGEIRVLRKTGKKGKDYSLIEGFSASRGEILV